MSFYMKLAKIGPKLFGKANVMKYGFNWSPMYRRSTGKIIKVSKDLMTITVKLPISYKNRNYANTIFGGSMFSAVDPIPMVQLINLIGEDYVVWDKSAIINFKRPAQVDLKAEFRYTLEELESIKAEVAEKKEIEVEKITQLTDLQGEKVYCEVRKIIYVADKAFYKAKRNRQKAKASVS